MHARGEAPYVHRLDACEVDGCLGSERLQAHERVAVHGERARREPALDGEVLEVRGEPAVEDGRALVGAVGHRSPISAPAAGA